VGDRNTTTQIEAINTPLVNIEDHIADVIIFSSLRIGLSCMYDYNVTHK
jgi:hypothetical protein